MVDIPLGQNAFSYQGPPELPGSTMAAPYQYTPAGAGQHGLTLATGTVTMTTATVDLTWTSHLLKVGQSISFTNSGGLLPTNIVAGQDYYVTAIASNTFEIAATPGGTAIIPATTSTGTTTAAALKLSPPVSACYANVIVSTAVARFTTDGVTTPTTSLGQPVAIGGTFKLDGPAMIASFKGIGAATATFDVEYYK